MQETRNVTNLIQHIQLHTVLDILQGITWSGLNKSFQIGG
jgi:hypothetical protein